MHDTTTVNKPASTADTAGPPLSLRYPLRKRKLLESIQADRGDDTLSDTIRFAVDRLIEEHFPGSTGRAA